jgi:Tfp pilus assembly major pilin PilA
MNRWHRQNGMTAIGWLLVLGLIAFFTLITLRLVPLYLEYAKVAAALESLENEPGITGKTKTEIVRMVQKRFEVNDVLNVTAKQLEIKKDKGVLIVSIDYERRENLISNIDVVAKFDKKVKVVAN